MGELAMIMRGMLEELKSINEKLDEIRGDRIRKLTADTSVIEEYEKLSTRNDNTDKKPDCEIRLLVKEDFEQVREIINAAFDMSVTTYDEPSFLAFVESGYSLVACKDDEILGVILAHVQPELSVPYVYINSFAVSEYARGKGIGKAMFMCLKKNMDERGLFMIKLQTDSNIKAYEIYKHWGFQDSELVQMKYYCF